MPSPRDSGATSKRKRVTRACDKCHRNGSKCSRNEGEARCVRCIELGIPCTFDRPVKRRGPPARRAQAEDDGSPGASGHSDSNRAHPFPRSRGSQGSLRMQDTPGSGERMSGTSAPTSPLRDSARENAASASFWRYDDLLDAATVEALADIYYRTAYPLRPFLHWPSTLADLRAGRYRSNWSVFIVTLAMCAIAAGKLVDGGVPGPVPISVIERASTLAAECYKAATSALDAVEFNHSTDALPLLKARSLLACTCMHNGDVNAAILHHGQYSIISAQSGFHDEANWPSDLTEIQRQERRRLVRFLFEFMADVYQFWYAYQCDQYNSNTFNLVPRHREARATVHYPAEADDEDISEAGVSPRRDHVSFMRGWNVCTDLYRVLEHVYDNLRADPVTEDEKGPGEAVTAFLSRASKVDAHAALRLVSRLLRELPLELRRVNPMTGDTNVDRMGFIATNLIITSQMLKMLIALSDGSSVHQRCAIASELLDELATLPTAYLQASSATTLQHLAHVGHLLSGVIDGPLPAWTYLQLRNILLVLSEFIATLEKSRYTPFDLTAKLRAQIQRIDESMSKTDSSSSLPGLGNSIVPPLRPQAAVSTPDVPLDPTLIAQADATMSINATLASASVPTPAALVEEAAPPHDALSALQLGSAQPTSSTSFSALGFAASQGMFDFGVAPMDDALIGEFLRYWPAQGVMSDITHDGMPFSSGTSGM